MIAVIDKVTPEPVLVSSGESEMIIVTILSTKSIDTSFLKFTNTKPNVADLRVNNKRGDVVFSKSLKLKIGKNQSNERIEFILESGVNDIGAIIKLEIVVVDESEKEISFPKTLNVSISGK